MGKLLVRLVNDTSDMKKILVYANKDVIGKQDPSFLLQDFRKKYKLKKIFPTSSQGKFKRFSDQLKKNSGMTRDFVSILKTSV